MKKQNKETALVIQSQSAEVLISQAINKGVDVATMTGLYELDKRWKADRAREAYFQALADFQGECPIIKKTKSVMNKADKGGGKRYSYAPLDVIVKGVGPILSKFGLSYTITVVQDEKSVEAKVRSTHMAGHTEETSFKVPIDPEAYMNAPQKFAAALTFAKRYAFCNAFGILTGDEDDDAQTIEYDATSKAKKTVEDPFQKVAKMLKATTNVSVLIDYSEKLAKTGCGFKPAEVKDLQEIVKDNVARLEK